MNNIVITPRSTYKNSDPVLRFPGDSSLPRSTAKKVAKLVNTIAKAQNLTRTDVYTQAGIAHGTLSRLLDDDLLTNRTLDKLKVWAKTFTKSK